MRADAPERAAPPTAPILEAHDSTLEWLRAGDLQIDHDHYQRLQDHRKIREIARDYKPEAMGVVIVSRRKEGDFVIDGGHRILGVIERHGPDYRVQSKVFLDMTLEEEAEVFYTVNSHRTPVKTLDKFRAVLAAGDPDITEIAGILDDLDLKYPWHGTGGADHSVICWGVLTEIHHRRGAEHLRRVLTLIENTWGSPLVALQAQFVKAVDLLICFHSQDEFWSLDEVTARLRHVSASSIHQESSSQRSGPLGRNKSAQQAIYELLHYHYNKGRKTRKLEDARTREPSAASARTEQP